MLICSSPLYIAVERDGLWDSLLFFASDITYMPSEQSQVTFTTTTPAPKSKPRIYQSKHQNDPGATSASLCWQNRGFFPPRFFVLHPTFQSISRETLPPSLPNSKLLFTHPANKEALFPGPTVPDSEVVQERRPPIISLARLAAFGKT